MTFYECVGNDLRKEEFNACLFWKSSWEDYSGVSIFLFTLPNLHYRTHKDSTISNEISKVHSIPINLWNIFQEHLYTPLSD